MNQPVLEYAETKEEQTKDTSRGHHRSTTPYDRPANRLRLLNVKTGGERTPTAEEILAFRALPTFSIGFSGKIGSGKDTALRLLGEIIEKERVPKEFRARPFALSLKRGVAATIGRGLSATMTDEGKNAPVPAFSDKGPKTLGELLQDFGQFAREKYGDKVWCHLFAEEAAKKSDWPLLLGAPDVRYLSEVETIKPTEAAGVVARLNGDPTGSRAKSKRDLNHSSETALDDYKGFDAVIDNSVPETDSKNLPILRQAVYDKVYLPNRRHIHGAIENTDEIFVVHHA